MTPHEALWNHLKELGKFQEYADYTAWQKAKGIIMPETLAEKKSEYQQFKDEMTEQERKDFEYALEEHENR